MSKSTGSSGGGTGVRSARVRPGFVLLGAIGGLGSLVVAGAGLGLGWEMVEEARAAREQREAGHRVVSNELARMRRQFRTNPEAAVAEVAPAVLMVGMVDPSGSFHQVGTGFVVGDDPAGATVVTNAHVGETVASLVGEGYRAVVRRPGADGPREWAILGEPVAHPGFARWAGVNDRGMARRGIAGTDPVSFVAPADVALLRTEPDVGPGLRLATTAELERLRGGERVFYVGYPAESLVGPRTNTPPVVAEGRLLAITGFAFEAAQGDGAVLLHHSVQLTGGSSGGPLLAFDPETGEPLVIGVHSAGSFVYTAEGRVPVSQSYAQRVDYVREMLHGDAERKQDPRDARWAMLVEGSTMSVEDRLGLLTESLRRYGEPREIRSWSVPLGPDEGVQSMIAQIETEGGALYAAVATARVWEDADLAVTLGDDLLGLDQSPDAMPIVVWRASADGAASVEISVHDVRVKSYAVVSVFRLDE